jgi:aminoglycoside phosphotransferase (APT) family kinase protein
MLVGPDFRVLAVMDWEQPSLGGALHDLGWWLYSDYSHTTGRGLTLEGMLTRDQTLALWSEITGHSTEGIEWYEAFAAFKMSCLGMRLSLLRGVDMPKGDYPEPGREQLIRRLDMTWPPQ